MQINLNNLLRRQNIYKLKNINIKMKTFSNSYLLILKYFKNYSYILILKYFESYLILKKNIIEVLNK